jgi:ABC-type glycerol-3-phosphate transport system permease component
MRNAERGMRNRVEVGSVRDADYGSRHLTEPLALPISRSAFRVPQVPRPGRVLLYAVLVAGAVFCAFPFVWMILTALKTRDEAQAVPITWLPSSPQWSNFVDAWNAAPFGRYFINTFFIAGCVVLGVCVTSLLAAYAFARIDFPGRSVVFALLLATLMIPFEATLVPNFIIIKNLHWYNTYAALIVPWIANVFSIFLLRQFILGIPEELFEAATLDGCGHVGMLQHVVLPLAKGPLAAIAVFSFLASWNSLLWPLIITGSESLRPIQLGLTVFVHADAQDPHLLMAASAFTIAPLLIVYFLAQRQFLEGIASSGLKG